MAKFEAERSIYNQLMDVMERLEKMEAAAEKVKLAHKEERKKDKIEIEELKGQIAVQETKITAQAKKMAAQEEKIAVQEKKITEQEKKIASQEETIDKLNNEIDRLKHRNDKDSHNSSLPPSGDRRPERKAPNEYNGRKKDGKKSGGQPGHKGRTLLLQETLGRLKKMGVIPEEEDIGDPTKPYKERLVLDISFNVRAVLKRFHTDATDEAGIPKEYRSEVTYGSRTKALAALLYGKGVQSAERIVEIISVITNKGIRLSQGSVFNWLEMFYRNSAGDENIIEERLLDMDQVSTDATVMTLNGAQTYIRNFSSDREVLYVPMEKKDLASLRGIPFLQKFAGILMHDHETALYHFGQGHAECNIHLLRYLTANTENTGHHWSGRMISLLLEMNRYRKRIMSQGMSSVPALTLQRLEARYDELLNMALEESKQHPPKYKWAYKEETSLLNRLRKYKANHLLFLRDFRVPFDNNISERDLRQCKNRQKMSGGFRKDRGKQIFCRLMSITGTCKRRDMDLMEAYEKVFSCQPVFA